MMILNQDELFYKPAFFPILIKLTCALIQEGLTLILRINAYFFGNSSTTVSLVEESTVALIKQSGHFVEEGYLQFLKNIRL